LARALLRLLRDDRLRREMGDANREKVRESTLILHFQAGSRDSKWYPYLDQLTAVGLDDLSG
jgi:hypothetical protein